ncbi:histone-like nucleoid-structuring protein Lsr2 [Allonocardiopsis opalescens]|uniref:Lsr2 protein n=1 Tax=Allonocardiopsis opalescens TaxID=1144618 RepID=A0A2T0QCL2_9ACTN|nr:Lsr2 family protein [Allonocardiopsis opalescens]PRY01652.1 Lsr2 protein [Allonocardiopsis opalescens]
MAQKVQVLLLCDLEDAEVEGDETVSFGWDGSTYEIDLCAGHARRLRDSLAPYVEHGRKVGAARPRRRSRGASSRERSADIRSWAREQGIQVNDRGRIPAEVVRKYEAAH